MDPETLAHKQDLIELYTRRLRVLEKQQASQGASCPPEVITEIHDIERKLNSLQQEIRDTQKKRSSASVGSTAITPSDLGGDTALSQDHQIAQHVRQLIEMIQQSSRVQTYIDVCDELLRYIEDSRNEDELSKMFLPFFKDKTDYILHSTHETHRFHYILARTYFLAGDYYSALENLERVLDIATLFEYKYLYAECLFRIAYADYKEFDLSQRPKDPGSRQQLTNVKILAQNAMGNLMEARKLVGGGSHSYKNLRQNIDNLLSEIEKSFIRVDIQEIDE